jgi:hypothetical protein
MLIDLNMRTRREADGVIYVTLTTNGATGSEWIEQLKQMGFLVPEQTAARILRSSKFKPLPSGTEINVAVLPDTFCSESDLSMEGIHQEAVRRGWVKAPAELACLIRRDISNHDMETLELCYISVIHDPIGGEYLTSSWRDGGSMSSFYQKDDPLISRKWGRNRGYAFVVPQRR